MAHFAQLNKNNIVINVIVVLNDVINNLPFPESESLGIDFCKSLYGQDTIWKQTSYNNNFRKYFAGIGFTYNSDIDAFIPPKPENNPSWVLNLDSVKWEPPIPMPTDGAYYWNEASNSWIEVPKPPYPSWILKIAPAPPRWSAPVPYPSDGVPFGSNHYTWDEESLQWRLVSDSNEIVDVP